MIFPEVNYMHWAKTVPATFKHSLAMSGIDLLATPGERGLTVDDMVLGGNNFYGYEPLRSAISERYGVPPKNILITQGTSLANFLIAAALLEQGDEVLVEQPAYEPLLTIFAPLRVAVSRIVRRPENGYAIDPADVRAHMTSRTKAILISNLHNPSSVHVPERAMRDIAEIAALAKATLIVDEVYQDFLPNKIPPSFLFADNIVTTNSLTKVYGLGGLRVGWAFASEEIVRKAYAVYNNLGVNNSFPGDHIAAMLMTRGKTEVFAARARERSSSNWPIVETWLATHPEITYTKPDGGICFFPRFAEGKSSRAFNDILQQQFDMTVVPGYFFEDDRGFRLGYGCTADVLREGLHRIDAALEIFLKA